MRRFRSIVRIPLVVAIAAITAASYGDPYSLETEYWTYHGATTATAGAPRPGPPDCLGAVFEPVDCAVAVTSGGLQLAGREIRVNIDYTQPPVSVGWVVVDLVGEYELDGEGTLVHLLGRIELPSAYFGYDPIEVDFDTAAAGFPMHGSEADEGPMEFVVTQVVETSSLIILGETGLDLRLVFYVAADGGDSGNANIRITKVRVRSYPAFLSPWLITDVNHDGNIDLLDIPAFVALLIDPPTPSGYIVAGDANTDGVIDSRDIQGFLDSFDDYEWCAP